MPNYRPSTSDSQRLRLPPLQTSSLSKQSTRETTDGPSTTSPASDRLEDHSEKYRSQAEASAQSTPSNHQRFVLTDPLAFRYLEEDATTKVLDRERELHGYECYVVEQWAMSRSHPTFVVTTYTGDPTHKVIVGVLSVPTDERNWSQRLRVYFKALNHYHATRRQTELGILMVTNLSSFPSSLTVILIPDGHVRKHRLNFTVNENLKRLGCSGRVGLTLSAPAAATIAKFHQLYRTSDRNEIYNAVIELVKLCQTALMLFGKLDVNFADGLLCDVTESAINDWWLAIGHEQYSVEPHDGILGPTTVAGLLGLLMGVRNRLHAVNAPVAKDAFDIEAMKKGIAHFQKQQKLARSRRLDASTLERLFKLTEKAANHDGWVVPKAVKSTVAELSGKGGEMMMDVVGRRDRAGIADIETCDIDRFTQLVYGDEPKWLWQGKQVKNHRGLTADKMLETGAPRLNLGLMLEHDVRGGFTWTARKSTVDGMDPGHRHYVHSNASTADTPDDETDEDDARHKSLFKRTSTLRHEAKTGIGKLKGAVRIRGHHSRPSRDDSPSSATEETSAGKQRRPIFRRAPSSPLSSHTNSPKTPTRDHVEDQDDDLRPQRHGVRGSSDSERARFARFRSPDPYNPLSDGSHTHQPSKVGASGIIRNEGGKTPNPEMSYNHSARERSPGNSGDENQDVDNMHKGMAVEQNVDRLLKRAHSHDLLKVPHHRSASEQVHRQLSFSLAEEGVLTWSDFVGDTSGGRFHDAKASLANEELIAAQAKDIAAAIDALSTSTVAWTKEQLQAVADLVTRYDTEQQKLDKMFDERLEASNKLHSTTEEMLAEQKQQLEEGSTDIETLISKLDYDISGLRSRVEEVEASVNDYERGVRRIEERVHELERDGGRASRCVLQ